ncbi:MAG: SH3 domain-containing protein [Pseudolabrys sp.]
MRILFLAVAAALGFAAPALAKPAYVASTVNLRAAPNTTSEIVSKIPAGSLIDADNCTDGWCAITWQDKSGFAIRTALDLSGRVPQRRSARPRVYEDGPDYVEGPPVYYEPGPYYYGYVPYYRRSWGWRHRW